MSLYKFMMREYAVLLAHSGIVRIGTLYEYRDQETHMDGIADRGEGTKETVCMEPLLDSQEPDFPEFARGFVHVSEGGRVVLRDSVLSEKEVSPDLYLFPTTEEYQPDMWLQFGYDTCVEIQEPHEFFRAITKLLYAKGMIRPGFVIVPCHYTDRSQDYKWAQNIHPAVIKPPSFAYQKEVRAIWTPRKAEIQPEILPCRAARKFCSIAP